MKQKIKACGRCDWINNVLRCDPCLWHTSFVFLEIKKSFIKREQPEMKVAFKKKHTGWGGRLWSLCSARGPPLVLGFVLLNPPWLLCVSWLCYRRLGTTVSPNEGIFSLLFCGFEWSRITFCLLVTMKLRRIFTTVCDFAGPGCVLLGSDVSKPAEMSRITKGIARNLSCAIRQRERPRLEKERDRKGRDTEWIVPQQTDGPFSLIFLSYSYRKPRRGGKRMPCSFSPSHFSFSASPLHFFSSFCPSVFTQHFFKKILLTLARLPLSPFLSIVPWCFNILFPSSSAAILSVALADFLSGRFVSCRWVSAAFSDGLGEIRQILCCICAQTAFPEKCCLNSIPFCCQNMSFAFVYMCHSWRDRIYRVSPCFGTTLCPDTEKYTCTPLRLVAMTPRAVPLLPVWQNETDG